MEKIALSSCLFRLWQSQMFSIQHFIGSTHAKTPSEDCLICPCKHFFLSSIFAR
nr:MAG TPA: hypothetical protein [Caudoviricetes sp.]